ncbi:DUF4232 domain-containing protein [Actinotalea ferrariae]|uniref:DUF4232 domain-containing protein n=1 Tax=Actinotalea ferrariae TaxID=1386098 RepID=UPI001C8C91DC|nr:DUF4232 domain-containing protein [Actinotalea ferrariae]MBX9246297.1 DUF4232 domain-containing protein [Actinotalea ferrariae]
MPLRPAAARAAMLLCLVGALAACSGPDAKAPRTEAVHRSEPAPRPTAPDLGPVATPELPAPAEAPATAPPPVAELPSDAALPCTDEDVTVAVVGSDAALGSRYLLLGATNTSAVGCVLDGRPALAFVRESGTPTPDVELVPRATTDPKPGPVVVPPGGTAYSELRWGAMSTALDPDETVRIRVRPMRGMLRTEIPVLPVRSDPGAGSPPSSLDILAGAEVEVGPWRAPPEGWNL